MFESETCLFICTLKNWSRKGLKVAFLQSLILCVFSPSIVSQNLSSGNPMLKNYSPSDYGASSQNWSVTQDSRGVMFFGNTQAVLEFYGKNWGKYELPNGAPARSLDINPEGTLFIGTFADFGYLSVKTNGNREFVSLANKIEQEEHKEFADIWRVVAVSSGTYFFTPNKIYCYTKGKISIIEAEMEAMFGFKAYDKAFVMLKDKGLAVIENNELIQLPYTSVFNSKHRMYTLIEFNEEKILIGTRSNGFFTYDLKLFKENDKYNFKKKVASSVIKHLESNAKGYIDKNSMYSAAKISDQLFAFGTITGGIVLVDQKGNVQRIINVDNGLNNNCVYSLFADEMGDLWAGLQQGISHIDLSYPLSFYNEKYNNLIGFVTSTASFKNDLYVGTMSGVFKYPGEYDNKSGGKLEFEKITEGIFDFWDFAVVKENLFTVGNGGVFLLKKGKFVNLLETGASVIEKLKFSEDYICVGHDEEFSLYKINGKNARIKLKKQFSFEGIDKRVSELMEIKTGELWLSTDFDGVYKITYNPENIEEYKTEHYTTKNGLPTNEYNSVQNINNKIVIATRKGLYVQKEDIDSAFFVQDASFGTFFSKDSASLAQIIPYKDQFIVNSEVLGIGFLNKEDSGSFSWDDQFSKRFPNVYKISTNNDALNIYTSNALYVYDLKNNKDFNHPFKTLIRKVYLKNDSIIFNGNNYNPNYLIDSVYASVGQVQKSSDIQEFMYKNNSLSFEFASAFFEVPEKSKYSYILEGFDNDWSNPSNETKAVRTNIPAGKYNFKVKAINVYGVESSVAEYRFIILPPFYMTIWAYLAYLVLFVLLIIGILKVYSRRLKAKNKELERIVEERTIEIRQKNKDILDQKEELEFKNSQINHSLNYARTIQSAMIPSKKIIDSFFDSFILSKPKDIVSGDFYWAAPVSPNNKKAIIVAVVDCTGHGVPGAFMSMIVMSLLNNLVNINKIYSPSLIIERLNGGIRKALRQEETNNNDGVDMGVIFAEEHNDKAVIVFSGAKLPILVYRKKDNTIERIKGSSSSLGGAHNIIKGEFASHNIFLESGDALYMFSDGYRDQNNDKRERYGSKRFGELIHGIASSDLPSQEQTLTDTLDAWQANEEQRDDVTVVGLRY